MLGGGVGKEESEEEKMRRGEGYINELISGMDSITSSCLLPVAYFLDLERDYRYGILATDRLFQDGENASCFLDGLYIMKLILAVSNLGTISDVDLHILILPHQRKAQLTCPQSFGSRPDGQTIQIMAIYLSSGGCDGSGRRSDCDVTDDDLLHCSNLWPNFQRQNVKSCRL